MKISRILLFPFTVVFRAILEIRYFLYRKKIFSSTGFDLPLISVGNLSMGGSGKTPTVEYLLNLLLPHYQTAVLSRGYKRKTSGFRMVLETDDFTLCGDEPLQIKSKYPQVPVAVGESRVMAVPHLMTNHPEVEVILLDDAFQHLSIKADLNILLSPYSEPYWKDTLFPMGNLREAVKAAARADLIVVTKCPDNLSEHEISNIIQEIKPEKNQRVFFSKINHYQPYNLFNPAQRVHLDKETEVLVFSGIASNQELVEYLNGKANKVFWYNFQDHYAYTLNDLENISESFRNLGEVKKILLTTEKDGVKLISHQKWFRDNQMEVYCLPIQVEFFHHSHSGFDNTVIEYLKFYFKKKHGNI